MLESKNMSPQLSNDMSLMSLQLPDDRHRIVGFEVRTASINKKYLNILLRYSVQ